MFFCVNQNLVESTKNFYYNSIKKVLESGSLCKVFAISLNGGKKVFSLCPVQINFKRYKLK